MFFHLEMQFIRLLIQNDRWTKKHDLASCMQDAWEHLSVTALSAINHKKKWIQWIGASRKKRAKQAFVAGKVLAKRHCQNLSWHKRKQSWSSGRLGQSWFNLHFNQNGVPLICFNARPCTLSILHLHPKKNMLETTCKLSYPFCFHMLSRYCTVDRPLGVALGLGWIQQSQAVEVPVTMWSTAMQTTFHCAVFVIVFHNKRAHVLTLV